ncbi:MAG: guaD [Rhodocyclales bacterium]|nr:guaD [Rhodocyclales bacterium]
MNPQTSATLVRGSILHFLADPGENDDADAWQFFEDGALLLEHGRVIRVGAWKEIITALPTLTKQTARTFDYSGKLVMPGLIDTHVHYPQMQVMGSFGRQLLDWLEHYTFPAEATFADRGIAKKTSAFFLDRLLAHGTTTASVFATVHPHSVEAFFEAAQSRNLRMLCGKVMMDRHCPENLRDTPASALHDSRKLIERWHGKGRLRYSVTPRFAPTSTPEQLQVAGELFNGYPDMHLQSHLSENRREIEWVGELFPGHRNYVDVYDHFKLLGRGAIYGHGIHLDASERTRLAETGTAIAFCPSSNLFLGSGFFHYDAAHAAGVPVGLATDVGGGTSLSMLRTMASAYTVGQAQHKPLSAMRAWYLATLGGAQALALDNFIGNFKPGKEADFAVFDFNATPELDWRMRHASSIEEKLFALITLGDERCVSATHILGERVTPA